MQSVHFKDAITLGLTDSCAALGGDACILARAKGRDHHGRNPIVVFVLAMALPAEFQATLGSVGLLQNPS